MTSEAQERAHLERAFAGLGPWRPEPSDLPPGGPARLWRGEGVVAWLGSPGRVAAEREGHARLDGHPARPALIAADERALIVAPFGPAADFAAIAPPHGPLHELLHGPRRETLRAPRRELLAGLGGREVDLVRALGRMARRLGERRRHVDRWLAAEITVETVSGLGLGGLRPGWWRRQQGRVVALRWDRARQDAWLALELAALTLGASSSGGRPGEAALRVGHAAEAQDPEAADRAFDLACLAVWLREEAIAKGGPSGERAEAWLRARLRPPSPPETVRVWIEGPSFVDPGLWERPGAEVPAARARWLKAHLDGLSVGGGALRVRTEPPIRAGRRGVVREPRRRRRQRLFSRWDRGIEVDDEGLVGVTPEALARRIASGASGVICDGTAGVGSLAIAFAREPAVRRVIAVDLDPERLAMARHNARIYGVRDRIEWVAGDVRDVLAERRVDVLVLDPPWGGRGYDRQRVTASELPFDLAGVLAAHRGAVILKLPRSFDVATLPGSGWEVEPMVDERGVLKMLVARRRSVGEDRAPPSP